MSLDRSQKVQRIKNLSHLLDTKFQGPMGFKFGLDGILGLIPIVGDTATSLMSFYIILEAALLGCSLPILLRMVLNVLIENILDFIPLIGNFFDFFWKSNVKNVDLIMEWERSPKNVTTGSWIIILFVALIFFSATGLLIYGSYELLRWIIQAAAS